jgi:hypothetical protein
MHKWFCDVKLNGFDFLVGFVLKGCSRFLFVLFWMAFLAENPPKSVMFHYIFIEIIDIGNTCTDKYFDFLL